MGVPVAHGPGIRMPWRLASGIKGAPGSHRSYSSYYTIYKLK